jgi:hypothetical protein
MSSRRTFITLLGGAAAWPIAARGGEVSFAPPSRFVTRAIVAHAAFHMPTWR